MQQNLEDATELPLLQSKVSVPIITPEFVHRPRLINRLNESLKGPLTLLSAPAGFGKTHLLADWVSCAGYLRRPGGIFPKPPIDNHDVDHPAPDDAGDTTEAVELKVAQPLGWESVHQGPDEDGHD
jgi:hypothetical protein